jgi:hypothetical protein
MPDLTVKARQAMIVVAALIVGFATAMAPPAGATDDPPEISISEGACGEVAFSAHWPGDGDAPADVVLVVATVEGQQTVGIGETVTVGPFDYESDTILYRVWGGEERAYDVPPLSDADAMEDHLAQGGSPFDLSAPGIAWDTLEIEGCPELTQVSPTEPTVTQFDCADDHYSGTVTIPDVEGVLYESAGATRYLDPGTYTASMGEYTFVAYPQEGYALDSGEETVVYVVVVEPVGACPEGTEPEEPEGERLDAATPPPAPAVTGEPTFTG